MNRINTAPPISSPRNRCGLDHRSVKRPRDIRGALRFSHFTPCARGPIQPCLFRRTNMLSKTRLTALISSVACAAYFSPSCTAFQTDRGRGGVAQVIF